MSAPSRAPFVGINAYTLADKEIFFEREEETALLKGLILAHRVVLLYGDSGNGKSSLINAGLVPSLQKSAPDFQPERLRVSDDLTGFDADTRPLQSSEDTPFQSLLSGNISSLAGDKIKIGATALPSRIAGAFAPSAAAKGKRGLLMFDQFEELHTLATGRGAFSLGTSQSSRFSSPDPQAPQRQRALAGVISEMLADTSVVPVKFLFVFREEFLAKLLALVPELNAAVPFRLAPLSPKSFPGIVAGPFLSTRPFSSSAPAPFFIEAAERVGRLFGRRSAGVGQNILTEIQVFCSELWVDEQLRAKLPKTDEALLAELNRVLETYFRKIVERLGNLREVAIALLCEMVTSQKTRNVVSESSLVEKLALENAPGRTNDRFGSARFGRRQIDDALAALLKNRIINESERSGARFFDLASEALIPWLSEIRRGQIEQIEILKHSEEERVRRRNQWIWAAAGATLVCAGLATAALVQRSNAIAQMKQAQDAYVVADFERIRARTERDLASAKAEEAERRAAKMEMDLVGLQKTLENQGISKEQVQRTTENFTDPLVARLADHKATVTAASFSRDGKWIATGSADTQLRLWTTAGKLVSTAPASSSKGGVSALAFAPDSRGVLTGSSGESVRLFTWPDDKLKQVWSIDRLADTVTWLEFSPSGNRCVCGSGGGAVALLKWPESPISAKPEVLKIWPHTHGQAVSMATFSSDGKRVVSSSDDGKVRVFNAEEPYDLVRDNYVGNPINLNAPTRGFRFSPGDSFLVAGGAGMKQLVWWRVASGQPALIRDDDKKAGPYYHRGAVTDVAFERWGKYFASVATDGTCIIWDGATARSIAQVPTEIHGRLFRCAWNNNLLALTGEDGWLEIWNVANPSAPAKFFATRAHDGVAWGVTFSPGGDLLMTWSNFPSQNVPNAVDRAATLDHAAYPSKSDQTAAIWDIKWCEKKGWTLHTAAGPPNS